MDNRANIVAERTIEALPWILDWLEDEGYSVVGIHEMAAMRGVELIPGKIYYDLSEEIQAVRVSGIDVLDEIIISDIETAQQINAVISPVDAAAQKYWYSENDDIADVDTDGNVTAVSPGSTFVTVIAGSKYARVKVIVDISFDIITKTTWDVFDWAGTDHDLYVGARAIGEEITYYRDGDDFSYGNVMKLSPPEGGYYYGSMGSMAMVYKVPAPGIYTLSYDAFVEPSDSTYVKLIWYVCDTNGGWGMLNDDITGDLDAFPVDTGKWLTRSGTCTISANSEFGLFARNAGLAGLNDATIYLKNLTLELEGAENPVIYIPEEKIPVSRGITLEWNDDDFSLLEETITISKGETISIVPAGNFNSYEWKMNGVIVGSGETFEFTGTVKGSFKLLLWVTKVGSGERIGASITIQVVD